MEATTSASAAARSWRAAAWLLLAALGGCVLWIAWRSLEWRMRLDTPLLHYMALMIDEQGAAPYRDVFVTSFPGALLFHLFLLRTVGPGDGAFMAANLVWLAALCAVTLAVLRPFGARAGLAACAVFALSYFSKGASMVLQRDAVLVLPLALAVLVHAREGGGPRRRAFWIGFWLSAAATIKPHALIGLPAVLWAERARRAARAPGAPGASGDSGDRPAPGLRGELPPLLAAAAGLALPAGAALAWVALKGGLPAFLEMVREYLPLHVRLGRNHDYTEGGERWLQLVVHGRLFGGEPGWLIAACAGGLAALAGSPEPGRRRGLVLLFLWLSVLYFAYVAVAGQYWNYHWMPFRWTVAVLAGLCLAEQPALARDRAVPWVQLGALILAVVTVLPVSEESWAQLVGDPMRPPDEGRVDEISAYLEEHLRPGDTVQALDWARGGVHAQLAARAHNATEFVESYHFYHHVDLPYVQGLRRRFMDELTARPPRFVIDCVDRHRPSGPRTAQDFPELERFVRARYRPVLEGAVPPDYPYPGTWILWERAD